MTVADLIMVLQQHEMTDTLQFVIELPNEMRYANVDRVVRNNSTVYLVGNQLFVEVKTGGG